MISKNPGHKLGCSTTLFGKSSRLFFSLFLCLMIIAKTRANEITIPTVTILADEAYPPYSYLENGQLKGIYINLLLRAADEIYPHYKIKLEPAPWKRALKEVENGHALAVIPPYKHLEARPYIWPYSIALRAESVVAFCHKDVNLNHFVQIPLEEKPPLIVGINSGYLILNDTLKLAKKQGKIRIWENKVTGANIKKLVARRLDCFLNDRDSTLWELARIQRSEPDINFNQIYEAMLVMTNTAHIGYSNTANTKYPHKQDFVRRMNEALIKALSGQ